MSGRRKRTEEEKLVFGVHRVCDRCRGKGKNHYEPTCRKCSGTGIIKEAPNGEG